MLQVPTQGIANWVEGYSFVSMGVQSRGGSLHILWNGNQ